jgi:hypothetical protein
MSEAPVGNVTLRLALICRECAADALGIVSVGHIVVGMSSRPTASEYRLPQRVTWKLVFWFSGPPKSTFRIAIDAKSTMGEPIFFDSGVAIIPDDGEGELWRDVGPLSVTEPGPIRVSLSFDDTVVWSRAPQIARVL